MTHQILSYIWFFGLALVWAIYVVQDAFITGTSILSIVYKEDKKVYKTMNSITGLHWDGIQVWLILAVGGMFAAFPAVYATTLSALYVPFFLLLYALIFRGVAIEVIYKSDSNKVQTFLKYSLSISSFLITLVIGVYLMNVFIGLPIDQDGYNKGFFSFLSLFNGIALLGGLMFVFQALVQGVNFIKLNKDKEYIPKMYKIAKAFAILTPFLMAFVFLGYTNVIDVFSRGLFGNATYSYLYLLPLFAIITAVISTLTFLIKKHTLSFIFNILSMILFIFTGFISMIPYAIVSTIDPKYGLLIIDGSAGESTLKIMFIALIIFLPIVIAYQAFKYIKFWGKV